MDMAAPNPSCPSYKRWRGVSKREQQRIVEDTKPPVFKSNVNVYVPSELQDLLQTKPKQFSPDDLESAVAAIRASDSQQWRAAVTAIWEALSCYEQPPIQEVIDLGALPRLVSMMAMSDEPKLQLEAAWALCNVASGTSQQCMSAFDAGLVPPAIALLSSQDPSLREQAAWLLGNVTGDGAALRDACVEAGLLLPLLTAVKKETELRPLRQLVWLLLNVTRFKPRRRSTLLDVLPTLTYLLTNSEDPEVRADGLSALAHVADDCSAEVVAGSGHVIALAAELLGDERTPESVALPAAKVLSALCTGEDTVTQAVVNTGVLAGGYLRFLQAGGPNGVLREVCFAISNIAAGTRDQAIAVRDAELMPHLVCTFRDCNHDAVRREALWALASSASASALADAVLEAGAAEVFADYLEANAEGTAQHEVKAAAAAANALLGLAKRGATTGGDEASRGRGGGEGQGRSSNPVVQLYMDKGVYETLRRALNKGLDKKALVPIQELLVDYPPVGDRIT